MGFVGLADIANTSTEKTSSKEVMQNHPVNSTQNQMQSDSIIWLKMWPLRQEFPKNFNPTLDGDTADTSCAGMNLAVNLQTEALYHSLVKK